jgi:hypothetical protein
MANFINNMLTHKDSIEKFLHGDIDVQIIL